MTKPFDNSDIIFERAFVVGESLPSGLSKWELYVILSIAFAPVAVLIFSVLLVTVFQARQSLGSWNLVWKQYMRKIGLLSATSFPP